MALVFPTSLRVGCWISRMLVLWLLGREWGSAKGRTTILPPTVGDWMKRTGMPSSKYWHKAIGIKCLRPWAIAEQNTGDGARHRAWMRYRHGKKGYWDRNRGRYLRNFIQNPCLNLMAALQTLLLAPSKSTYNLCFFSPLASFRNSSCGIPAANLSSPPNTSSTFCLSKASLSGFRIRALIPSRLSWFK